LKISSESDSHNRWIAIYARNREIGIWISYANDLYSLIHLSIAACFSFVFIHFLLPFLFVFFIRSTRWFLLQLFKLNCNCFPLPSCRCTLSLSLFPFCLPSMFRRGIYSNWIFQVKEWKRFFWIKKKYSEQRMKKCKRRIYNFLLLFLFVNNKTASIIEPSSHFNLK
jgi:hypothetical protein